MSDPSSPAPLPRHEGREGDDLRRLLDALRQELLPFSAQAQQSWSYDNHQTSAHALLRDSFTALSNLVALQQQIVTLTQERDDAVLRAERAWAAATDETCVGFHRDMAFRLSEDRDIQKHAARKCRERAEAAESSLAALLVALRALKHYRPELNSFFPDQTQNVWTQMVPNDASLSIRAGEHEWIRADDLSTLLDTLK